MTRGKLSIKLKTAKNRSNSSARWLQRQLNDPYVYMAKKDNFRSRAAYKLIQINQTHKIIKKMSNVLDLGSSPGSWSQVVKEIMQDTGKIFAVDLLEMQELSGINFIQADFIKEQEKIRNFIQDIKFHTILSDIAPSTSGISFIDHCKIIDICKEILIFAQHFLQPNGSLLMKIFQGQYEQQMVSTLKQYFTKVRYVKPKASRTGSSEIYLLSTGYIVPNIQ